MPIASADPIIFVQSYNKKVRWQSKHSYNNFQIFSIIMVRLLILNITIFYDVVRLKCLFIPKTLLTTYIMLRFQYLYFMESPNLFQFYVVQLLWNVAISIYHCIIIRRKYNKWQMLFCDSKKHHKTRAKCLIKDTN